MSLSPRILLSPPDVGLDERAALLEAFDSNWISTAGPAIGAFEDAMAAFVGRPCVAVSSGTAGLHLALRLAGVSAGDLVLCQTFTFVASANPILYEKAVPCFVDSEPRTWNLDPNALEDALRSFARTGIRPKALIAVHLYGMPAEIAAIRELCQRYGVALVEDAAESLGSAAADEQTGRFGMAGVYSFNGNKIITTAGGGMIAVESETQAARLRKWSTQSRDAGVHYQHSELGFNYRVSNLLAALGVAQLARLPEKVARRREIFERYRRNLRCLPGIHFQPEAPGNRSNRWLTALHLDPGIWGNVRDALIAHLAVRGIESRPLWKPMHRQPLFRDAQHFGTPFSETLFANGLCLPSGSALSIAQQQEICDEIAMFLQRASGRTVGLPGCGLMTALDTERTRQTANTLQPAAHPPDETEEYLACLSLQEPSGGGS
ncbi:MAG: aminotransferase class I/II-fold pyridoxal phosphate-dependent enzyme [Bryobacterales bacterium]|nr:aminotransferase class I/II-fold pyridoxal phosphate-dependent enzyme [Bryobacterales bacterium]